VRPSHTPEYIAWHEIKQRCLNPNRRDYPDYGGRGITICERWRDSFHAFLADVGPRPAPEYSIGRLENDGHYEPGNAAWQTKEEQANNTRRNRFVEYKGERMTMVQACRLAGLGRKTVWWRLKSGWRVEDALCIPAAPTHLHVGHPACNHKLEPQDLDVIAALYGQGATKRSIAARFGVSSCTVKRALDRYNQRESV
jgi:hypothetical protein